MRTPGIRYMSRGFQQLCQLPWQESFDLHLTGRKLKPREARGVRRDHAAVSMAAGTGTLHSH